jgi:hypothetical protein
MRPVVKRPACRKTAMWTGSQLKGAYLQYMQGPKRVSIFGVFLGRFLRRPTAGRITGIIVDVPYPCG